MTKQERRKKRTKRHKNSPYQITGLTCWMCGYGGTESHIPCLEFHHIHPENKSYELGSAITKLSFDKILLEVKKCALLCCRCHREFHAGILSQADVEECAKDMPEIDEYFANAQQKREEAERAAEEKRIMRIEREGKEKKIREDALKEREERWSKRNEKLKAYVWRHTAFGNFPVQIRYNKQSYFCGVYKTKEDADYVANEIVKGGVNLLMAWGKRKKYKKDVTVQENVAYCKGIVG